MALATTWIPRALLVSIAALIAAAAFVACHRFIVSIAWMATSTLASFVIRS